MPKDEADPEDPNEIVGVAVPVSNIGEAQELLARGLAEEYVRFGFREDEIVWLFNNPFYAGAYAVRVARGEEFIRKLVRESIAIYRPMARTGKS